MDGMPFMWVFLRFADEWPLEFMVSTWWCPSAEGIKCPTVSLEYIPATNHQVWWWLHKIVCMFIWLEPTGLFSVGIHQAESVCNPSTNTERTSKSYYRCLCQCVTCHAIQCAVRSAGPYPDIYFCIKTLFWKWQINEPHLRQVQFCSTWSNKHTFCDYSFASFFVQDVFLQ